MEIHFFRIPVRDGEEPTARLNEFLRDYHITSIKERFVEQGDNSFWAIQAETSGLKRNWGQGSFNSSANGPQHHAARPKAKSASATTSKFSNEDRIDYRDVLSPEDFEVYAKMREWRKETSKRDSVPVYSIVNNAQLAEVVRSKASSLSDLEGIMGIGSGKLKRYGEALLQALGQHRTGEGASHETNEPAV